MRFDTACRSARSAARRGVRGGRSSAALAVAAPQQSSGSAIAGYMPSFYGRASARGGRDSTVLENLVNDAGYDTDLYLAELDVAAGAYPRALRFGAALAAVCTAGHRATYSSD